MLLSYLAAALLAGGTVAASREQAPLVSENSEAAANQNTFVVTHEAHPEYSLTLTAHHDGSVGALQGRDDHSNVASVCPGATGGYTGYLNKGDKHFYFAYCEYIWPMTSTVNHQPREGLVKLTFC